jgi:DNA-binding MarR family transcriptional regulator
MVDFYDRTGKMALGSRLRRLSEQMTEQAAAIYDLYQVDLLPKWFPVFYSLSATEERSITDIAREIGHTHPSVSQIVREMAAKGYIVEKKGEADGRKNFILLSPAGSQVREKMQAQLDDVTSAIETAMKETHHDLWKAIAEWEFLLEQKSLLRRVQEEKKSKRKPAGPDSRLHTGIPTRLPAIERRVDNQILPDGRKRSQGARPSPGIYPR